MALSQDLINQFTKLTSREKENKEVTVNGTYKTINGEEYVKLDGSDIWTPVVSMVEAEDGERVSVLIKNHTATVTGNITSPAARNKSVQNLKEEVDEFGNTIQQMDNTITQQGNSITQIDNNIQQIDNSIQQIDNVISQHDNVIQQIDNTIRQQGNNITQMNNTISQQGNQINQMNDTIESHGNTINQQNNTIQQQGNIIQQQGNLISQQGNQINQQQDIIESQGNTITQQGNTINQQGNTINEQGSNITILNSAFTIEDGVLKGLASAIVDNLKTTYLNATYADIDFTNINFAAVQKLFTESGIIKDLIVQEGKITGELVGVTIKGDLIEGNTIKADKLVVKGEDGLYYKLNIDGLDNIGTEQASKFVLTESEPSDWDANYKDYYTISNNKYIHVTDNIAPTWQTNTYYKLNSDHQSGLDGTVIIAKSVTADKIQVSDLVAFDATIGGFNIDTHSIYSGSKSSIDSPVSGIYLDDSGQMNVGDDKSFIKRFLNTTTNRYELLISADVIVLGGSNKTMQETLDDMQQDIDNTKEELDNLEIGGRNWIINSCALYENKRFWGATENLGYITSNQNGGIFDRPYFNFSKELTEITQETIYNSSLSNRLSGLDGTATLSGFIRNNSDSSVTVSIRVRSVSDTPTVLFTIQKELEANSDWIYYNITDEVIGLNDNLLLEYIISNNTDINIDICSFKLETGNKATDWTPAPEDVDTEVEKRATIEELNTAKSELQRQLNDARLMIDSLNAMIQTLVVGENGESLMEQTDTGWVFRLKPTLDAIAQVQNNVDNTINGVQNSGGNNFIRNSVMFAYDSDRVPNDWTVSGNGSLDISSNVESLSKGAISGNVFMLNDKTVTQLVRVTPGVPYTFTTRIKKGTTGSCYAKLYNTTDEHIISIPNGTSAFYEEQSLQNIIPSEDYYYVEFYGSSNSNATFTDNMLAFGEFKSRWQQASGEVMNAQVNIDQNGILIKSSRYQGDYTVMSPLEFAGYSNVNGVKTKVFSLNKDTTEVERLKSRKSIEMPPIKILPITTGDLQGWAFVPSTN